MSKHITNFINVTRLNKPIGFLLLFWPCTWGLSLAFYFDKNLDLRNESFLTQIFEMNSNEEVLIEIKNKKVFRFNIDTQLTPEIMGRIFSLRKKEFLFFFDKSKLFLVFVENITPNDVGKELNRTLMSQREEFFKKSLRQNFINNYLNFIKRNTDINVNQNLIESTLSNLRRTG